MAPPLTHWSVVVMSPSLVNTYKEKPKRSVKSLCSSMDQLDEQEYLPYHLKGIEIDELTELLEGCGILSDAGGSVNISFIADSMRRRIVVPASDKEQGMTDIRLTFTASVSHCPICGAKCSSLSQQLEGSVEELSQMSCESNPSDGVAAKRSHEPIWKVSLKLKGRVATLL